MSTLDTRRRVKVYMLNEDRQWDDRGTGHVTSTYVERLKGMSLMVISETDGSLLLESKIQHDTTYQKQQETLIVWSEHENYNLALSFQEKASCDDIWEKICQVQGRDPNLDVTQQDIVEESEDERFEEVQDTSPPIEMPPCELSKLEDISCLCSSILPCSQLRREKLANAIECGGYIQKLIDMFHMCEDLENLDGLHHLYDIFKSIFLLNKNALFEIMFADNMIFSVIGVLEYDPSLQQPAKHREYLRNTAKFKEVIPVHNEELLRKIHQTFRVQYIQDVILPTPSVFEENMLSTLSSFIYFNKVEIVTMIQDDQKFLKHLFAQLTDDETDDSRRRDLVFFLKEYCTFSQTLQPQNRDNFFKILSSLGILHALEVILALDDEVLKAAAIDIFSYIVEINPSVVREFILQEGQTQDDDDLLINLVIEQIKSDADPDLGGAVQLMGIVRLLIDPENMMASHVGVKTEKTEFLNFFYKRCMHVLTAPLFANTTDDKPSKDDYQTAQLLAIILELLTFCVEHHTYHIRNYIFNKDLLRRVLVLLKSKHGFLALGALRFMRKMIGLKDEFYFGYIIKGHLFKSVVDAFVNNGKKYNLFNSAVIELFEFVKTEDCKSLVNHIIENHYKSFENVDYVQTFRALKIRYEQQMMGKEKPLDSMPSILRNNRYRRDTRMLDEEEEMWFDQEEEMEDNEALVPMTDMLRSKIDSDFEHMSNLSKVIENKKAARELDIKESPPLKLHPSRTASPININIKTNPVSTSPLMNNQHTNSLINRTGSPTPRVDDAKTNTVTTRKPGLIGLVDYPDEDSDEEEEEGGGDIPAAKRPRITT